MEFTGVDAADSPDVHCDAEGECTMAKGCGGPLDGDESMAEMRMVMAG